MSRADNWTDADITEYAASEETDERPNWEPQQETEMDTGSRVVCPTCGNDVSKRFARVFGDDEDNIDLCNECATYRELKRGAVHRGDSA